MCGSGCFWRVVDYEALLIALGGFVFPTSNDEVQIQQLAFLLEF